MKLYKFKSLKEFEYVADIIMNNRLYSADFKNLNDPMEGVFYSSTKKKNIVMNITESRQKQRVCSLSRKYNNPLLWAHYADSFRGVCIEIEVDESIVTLHDINYTHEAPTVIYDRDDKFMGELLPDPEEWAVRSLTRKFEEWSYEKEIRILNNSSSSYIEVGIRVVSVIFGVNTSEMYQDIITKIIPNEVDVFKSKFIAGNKVVKVPI